MLPRRTRTAAYCAALSVAAAVAMAGAAAAAVHPDCGAVACAGPTRPVATPVPTTPRTPSNPAAIAETRSATPVTAGGMPTGTAPTP